ncbi:MAG: hypothetical protein QF436_01155 [Candidatus Woesearchaeota archaeon]|jgi:hypothetical protein|nr:hypothetical protein [Candidatus Woesearchaeota archaeon]MDP7622701.1 hypothetical protein [Candidatus Woesearchaeota archaeon]HJN57042.1 hypothetical protein [Candidatus Woesearchaeota archaeon]|tara:strand:- start:308 stop:814 length:507 start_codon:yes stop_codon:yes gene_type:complete
MEKKQIVFDLRLSYNGPLSIEKFYEEVEKWIEEKGLQKELKRKLEDVESKGKKIEWVIEAWKSAGHHVKPVVRLRALFNNVKEVKIKRNKKTVKINQADALMVIDGFLETEFSTEWTMKPLFYFFRTLYDKYIWKVWSEKYDDIVSEDCYDLHKRIKAFFELYKMKVG